MDAAPAMTVEAGETQAMRQTQMLPSGLAEPEPEPALSPPSYHGQVHGVVAGTLYGHVKATADEKRTVMVEVRINGFTSPAVAASRPSLGAPPSKLKGVDRSFYIPITAAWLANGGGTHEFALLDAETGEQLALAGPDRFDWQPLAGHIDNVTAKEITGWAVNCDEPQLPLRVMARVGSDEVARGLAILPRPDLRELGDRTGAYGFKLAVTNSRPLVPGAEVRLYDEQSGRAILPGACTVPQLETDAGASETGSKLAHGITGVHGLTIEGWIADPTGKRPPRITLIVNGVPRQQIEPNIPSARAFLAGGDINGGFKIWLPSACADVLTPQLPRLQVTLKTDTDGTVLWEGALAGSAIRLEYIRSLMSFAETTSVHPLATPLGQANAASGAEALRDLWKDAAARQKQAAPLLPGMMLALIDRLVASGQVEAAISALIEAPQPALLNERGRYVRTILSVAYAATPDQAMTALLGIARPIDKKIRAQNFFFKAASLALRARAGTCLSLVREALIILGTVKFGDSATSAVRDIVGCFASPEEAAAFNYLVTSEIVGQMSNRSENG